MIVCVYNLSERSGGNITKCALILNLRLSVRSPSGLADGYRKIEKCYSHFLFHAASTSTIFAIRKYLFLYLLDFLTVRKLQNCSSMVLVLLRRLRDNHFAVLQNGTGGGIRGRCPSATANKWENGTSVYIFPMLAIASIGRIFDSECI